MEIGTPQGSIIVRKTIQPGTEIYVPYGNSFRREWRQSQLAMIYRLITNTDMGGGVTEIEVDDKTMGGSQ